MDPIRVLLVDDEEELVYTVAERLRIRKIACEAVTSGEEALRLIMAEHFDVVLLDVKMPGLGGIEVMRQIKLKRPEVQVILITGHGSAEDGESGLREGAYDYVMKPINIELLMQKMQNAAGRGAGG